MKLLFRFTLLLGRMRWALSLPMLLGVGCVSLRRGWPFHPGWCRGGSLAGSRPSGAWEQEPTLYPPCPDTVRCCTQVGPTHRPFQNLRALWLASAVPGARDFQLWIGHPGTCEPCAGLTFWCPSSSGEWPLTCVLWAASFLVAGESMPKLFTEVCSTPQAPWNRRRDGQ